MDFAIRKAVSTEAEELSALAHAAKRHWGYPEELIRLWADDLTVTAAFITKNAVHCAIHEGKIIGFFASSIDRGTADLAHMWVDPKFMGMGVGGQLLKHAIALLASQGCHKLRIESDPNAVGFYVKAGAVAIGQVPSRPEGRTLPLLAISLEALDQADEAYIEGYRRIPETSAMGEVGAALLAEVLQEEEW